MPERFAIQFHRRFRLGKTDAIRAKPGLSERKDITLIFIHIPKTAGTSIRSLLQGLVTPRKSVYLYPQGKAISKEEFKALPAERKAQIRVVMGHVMYGIHELLPQQVRYVTMLRDPVDRVVSLYHHIKRIPEHPLHQSVVEKNLTLEEFVFSGRFLGADNEMVRHISGVRGLGFGQCSADVLKLAYRNIETHFECVLLMENMPRSIARLSEILGIPVKGFLKKNVK